ncbi:hypothetical protein SDC9_128753 [bioreactor metagenome]|uniref:Uncharacterized protein n=1 Tax=bioreactor metagenome TaxID=1076179 RepID=A0A645CX56_9ZZZZ
MKLNTQIAVGHMVKRVGDFINIALIVDQLLDGKIEGFCQCSHFILGTDRKFHIEVSVSNSLCNVCNFLDRL